MLDELLASPTDPAPEVHTQRIAAARAAAASMRSPETASITAWSLCCMVGNILETMLQHGLVADPDGLLQDGFDALKRATEATRAPGDPVILPPADFPVVEAMVEDWAAVMVAMPARDIIRAFRATDRRIRDIEAGRTAGCKTAAVTYGYIHPDDNPRHWGADVVVDHPLELRAVLDRALCSC